jgi:hypothetical protein
MNFKKNLLLISIQLFLLFPIFSKNIVWTGNAGDGAFFNEANWKNEATNLAPPAGTIDPFKLINANLSIINATSVIGGTDGIPSDILFGKGSLLIGKSTLKMAAAKGIDLGKTRNKLTIDSAVVTAGFLKNANTTLTGDSKLYLTAADPFDVASNINITSNDAWIFAKNLNPTAALTSHIPRIKLNGSKLADMINARISQYYNGCAIAAYSSTLAPLRIFDASDLNGNNADITVQVIKSGAGIPSNMNNSIASFKLKKGYMVTFAVNDDGTGMSKVYIASESDLTINELPSALSGKVSFIRVLPWVWVNKKGFGKQNSDADFYSKLNTKGLWYYDWGLSRNSTIDFDYAPMSWGNTGIDTPAKQNTLINKNRVTHILSFNEADNCKGQSGQYGSLCNVDTAAFSHQNLMKTGLRIVSPSCRENEELKWLKNVNALMIPAGTRMDAIGMHWYDWGGYLSGAPSDANSIFNRFKNKVVSCYNFYKMPIWITEFDANKNRPREIQDAFLKLALPWLEETPYVERYAYYQPENGKFLDASGNLTSTGSIYLNQVSSPSIPENLVNTYINNLESRMSETTTNDNIVTEKEQ